jgi:hypothetical protein
MLTWSYVKLPLGFKRLRIMLGYQMTVHRSSLTIPNLRPSMLKASDNGTLLRASLVLGYGTPLCIYYIIPQRSSDGPTWLETSPAPPFHIQTNTYPVSETLWYNNPKMMDNTQHIADDCNSDRRFESCSGHCHMPVCLLRCVMRCLRFDKPSSKVYY